MQHTDEHTAEPAVFNALRDLVASPEQRHQRNTEMVTAYYSLVDDLYRASWGESHHLPPLRPGESLAAGQRRKEQDLADRARLTAGMTALDIGSGAGGPAVTIATHTGAEVVGVDLSPVRIASATRHTSACGAMDRVTFVEGDAARLPFPDRSFDVCYSLEAICHIPDKQRVHAEAYRVLKPGGRYVGYDWFEADSLTAQQRERFIEPVCRHHCLPSLATPATQESFLRHAGFTPVEVRATLPPEEMTRTWDLLEHYTQQAAGIDAPLVAFMAAGATALVHAARGGHFTVGTWEAHKR